jgi:uncharacterized protein (TIGR00645 family)
MSEPSEASATPPKDLRERMAGAIEDIILGSRYLLVPLMGGLLFVILTITLDFFHMVRGHAEAANLSEHVLRALELLDIAMIANLIWLISAGSYYVFVDNNYPGTSGKKRPRCLAHVSSGILKEKMAGSLIGVSSITLLHMFLNLAESNQPVDVRRIGVLVVIHLLFIAGLLAFNRANEADHHQHDKDKKKAATPAH